MKTSLQLICVLFLAGCTSQAPDDPGNQAKVESPEDKPKASSANSEEPPEPEAPGVRPFVIPTGGMAETLLGHHRQIRCTFCGHTYRLNASDEVAHGLRPCLESQCVNCRRFVETPVRDSAIGGDRISADRSAPRARLSHFDVIVFNYPLEPEKIQYVKRLVGLPGETIAIWGGDLYAAAGLSPKEPRQDPQAVAAFTRDVVKQQSARKDRKFAIVRKSPDQILAMRALVHDNRFQSKEDPPRWQANPEGSWKLDDAKQPRRFELKGGRPATLTYRHLLGPKKRPALINDFSSYNSARGQDLNWVSDLMLECRATLAPDTLVELELASGPDQFRAEIDVRKGRVRLLRTAGKEFKELDSKQVEFDVGEEPRLRFANVDQRLILWLGDELPFGEGVAYTPTQGRGPRASDLEPCRIQASGAGTIITDLKVWRDIYYTTGLKGEPGRADAEGNWADDSASWSDVDTWQPLHHLPAAVIYVKPEHYLVLGDNSRESSDGRDWGLVPGKLYIGKVTRRYWPLARMGPVH